MTKKTFHPCIYCGRKRASDNHRDHVPPKAMFPSPRPYNLITVPSCLACNQAFQMNDDYFMAHVMSTTHSDSPALELLKPKLLRMVGRPKGVATLLRQQVELREMHSVNGLYLGVHPYLTILHDRIRAFMRRLTFALFYHEFNQVLPKDIPIDCRAIDTSEMARWAEMFVDKLRSGSKSFPGVFEFRRGVERSNHFISHWLFRFYDGTHYYCVTGKELPAHKIESGPIQLVEGPEGKAIMRRVFKLGQ